MDGMMEQVRLRAYELWQMDGMTPGREIDHWTMAERELHVPTSGGAAVKTKTKTKTKVKLASAPARKSAARKIATGAIVPSASL